MRARSHINWALVSALLALAIGLLLEQAAVTANDQRLRRAALLLIVYGLVIAWLQTRAVVVRWWRRTVCAFHSWLSDRKHISE